MYKVLVAEDSNVDAKYIESILKEGGYELFLQKMEKKLKN